jgi:hypothetical protein
MLTLQVFIYLQVLDLMTTLVGFRFGAHEASPFIAKLIHTSSPLMGVAASKLLALLIAGILIARNRAKLIGVINYWYAGLVVWNLSILLFLGSHTA